jgi:cysteine synthase A
MLDLIGNIPLVRLNRICVNTGAEILVKPEFLNPSGSIKDRIALLMIEEAEKSGMVEAGAEIVEATTGNTGTALAFVAAIKGYRFTAYAPENVANKSRMSIMTSFGANTISVESDFTKVGSHTPTAALDTSVHGARVELVGRQICLEAEAERNDVWWARQFSNPNNAKAHSIGTAKEILEMTDGSLDAFVTSVGTGGTLLGVAQVLKDHNPNIKVIGVEPAGSPMIGDPDSYPVIPGISDGIIMDIFESELVDEVIAITDEEAIGMAHQLAECEGMFCGMSSGANVLASTRVAERLGNSKRIVTILPDSRDRYLEVEKYTT